MVLWVGARTSEGEAHEDADSDDECGYDDGQVAQSQAEDDVGGCASAAGLEKQKNTCA